MRPPAVPMALLGLLVQLAASRAADLAGRDVQLRVMAPSVPVRAGPGGSFREVGRVGRGQVFEALDRAPDGDWYRIRLARGISGWVLAELVWPFEVADAAGPGAVERWLFEHLLAVEQLADGALSATLAGGVLDRDGLFSLRLGYQPSRHWMIEAVLGQSAGHLGSVLLYGAEVLVAVGPWRCLVPFIAVGGGAATTLPHRDNALFAASTRPLVSAGGGLLLALRGGFGLRLDARQLLAFDADELVGVFSFSAGLMLSF